MWWAVTGCMSTVGVRWSMSPAKTPLLWALRDELGLTGRIAPAGSARSGAVQGDTLLPSGIYDSASFTASVPRPRSRRVSGVTDVQGHDRQEVFLPGRDPVPGWVAGVLSYAGPTAAGLPATVGGATNSNSRYLPARRARPPSRVDQSGNGRGARSPPTLANAPPSESELPVTRRIRCAGEVDPRACQGRPSAIASPPRRASSGPARGTVWAVAR
jgi:hypothetical protein